MKKQCWYEIMTSGQVKALYFLSKTEKNKILKEHSGQQNWKCNPFHKIMADSDENDQMKFSKWKLIDFICNHFKNHGKILLKYKIYIATIKE
jgi:hypothetical protein